MFFSSSDIFSNDSDLGSEFPDLVLSATMTAFATGKTSWEEQHVRAAEILIKDLKKVKGIHSSSQILDHNDFRLASVCKVAEIIYTAFGNDYLEQKYDSDTAELIKEEVEVLLYNNRQLTKN